MYKLQRIINVRSCFLPLTGKNVSWKIRHNFEPHQNFTDFYKKGIEALDELQNP